MILVIADDLTGAAEIAGAAFQYGLTAEVQMGEARTTDADVLVLDTESRSLSKENARRAVEDACSSSKRLQMEWVYKKVDSILRGHVRTEIEVMQRIMGMEMAVLFPANPSKKRTVVEGQYLVDGVPLHKTELAEDPDFPRTTSTLDRLSGAIAPGFGRLSHDSIPVAPGIYTADISSQQDLSQYASVLGRDVLSVGALDYFRALLEIRVSPSARADPVALNMPSPSPTLFVCGSVAGWRAGREEDAARHNVPAHVFPSELLDATPSMTSVVLMVNRCIESLNQDGCALLAIGRSALIPDVAPKRLCEHLALSASIVVSGGFRGRLCIEGGGTAAAFMEQFDLTRFQVSHIWDDGVVSLIPNGLKGIEVVVKVGSYTWPEEIWVSVCTPATKFGSANAGLG